MLSTADWAESFGISAAPVAPPIPDDTDLPAHSASEVAVRCVILHGIVAVAAGVDAEPITDWFRQQEIWASVSRDEQAFLAESQPDEERCRDFQWHMEAEWTLFWTIGRVDTLGLPTKTCDTGRLIDEIMPPLDSDIEPFVDRADFRSTGELLAEDDRTYNLWCRYRLAKRNNDAVPEDLNSSVLYERRYAFEWLEGNEAWDDVTCDA